MRNLTVTIPVSVLVSVLESTDLSDLEITVLKAAVGADSTTENEAPAVPEGTPPRSVGARDILNFLESDPRFTRRSVKATAEGLGVTEDEIRQIITNSPSFFRTFPSTRGLGTLIEARA